MNMKLIDGFVNSEVNPDVLVIIDLKSNVYKFIFSFTCVFPFFCPLKDIAFIMNVYILMRPSDYVLLICNGSAVNCNRVLSG